MVNKKGKPRIRCVGGTLQMLQRRQEVRRNTLAKKGPENMSEAEFNCVHIKARSIVNKRISITVSFCV